LQVGSLPTGIRYPFGGFAALYNGHITRLDKRDGLDVAKPDTLRIAVTDVALEDPPIGGIVIHSTEGTYADAGTAADTGIIVNAHATQFFILRDGLDRTDIQTGRILTLLACHGYINAFGLPFQHPDPAAGRIGYSIMRNRTHKLTQPAARAFLVIYI